MAKVNIKSEKITPFGGIYYASKAFYTLSLDKVINSTIDVRCSTYNDYQWNETMSAMSDVFLCGDDCVKDVNRFLSYFIRAVSSVFTSLSPTSRIKKFVFHFTAVCAKWTRTARRWWLNLYTGMPYDKLSFG